MHGEYDAGMSESTQFSASGDRCLVNAQDIIATVDAHRYAAIVERWGVASGPADERRQKYLDLPRWIEINLKRVKRLGLDTGPSRRVLDIGCGCGHFLYICKLFGHDAIGIDRSEESSLFVEVRDLLGVPWIAHTINAGEPLPELGRADVVTAHMVTFNGHRRRPWGPDEWTCLLDSIPAPVWYLEFNREPDGTLFTPGLAEMLAARGAETQGHRVMIDRRAP
jgi:SAM-dependent methyltransferase